MARLKLCFGLVTSLFAIRDDRIKIPFDLITSIFAICDLGQCGDQCAIDVEPYTPAHRSSIIKLPNRHIYFLVQGPRSDYGLED